MTRLLTNHICTMTELREPHKVLERSGGKPVAILRNSQLVGYLVPEEATDKGQHQALTVSRCRNCWIAPAQKPSRCWITCATSKTCSH